ncbi:MAG TPA: hypothetical protein VKB96_02670, partial [Gammaproteobacteria bacterium]|nr:hypothetical protein [Gammaproteobacteria bacterium]
PWRGVFIQRLSAAITRPCVYILVLALRTIRIAGKPMIKYLLRRMLRQAMLENHSAGRLL